MMKKFLSVVAILSLIFLPPTPVFADTIVKADNVTDLDTGGSWVGGIAPGANDIAEWNTVVSGPNTTVLGADLEWQGIAISDPSGLVTINAGNTLTIGAAAVDIDMSSATADLTLNCALTLGAANVWNVSGSQSLTVAAVDGTTDFTEDLTINAESATIAFSGIVGGTTDLGDVLIITAENVTASSTFTAASLTQSAGSGASHFVGAVDTTGAADTAGGAVSVTTAGAIDFDSTITTTGGASTGVGRAGGAVTINSTGSTVDIDNTITTSGSAGAAGGNAGGAGGAVDIDASTTVNVDAITTTGGAGTLASAGGAAGAITITSAGVGPITLEDNIAARGGATVTGTGGAGGAVTLESPVALGAGITIDTRGGIPSGAGTLGVGGSIDFQGTLNGTQTLGLNTAGSTDGDIHFHGIVGGAAALGAVTIDDAKDVTASAAFTAARLTQSAGSGASHFAGAVDTTGAADTAGGAVSVTTAGAIDFDSTITTTGGASTGVGRAGGAVTINSTGSTVDIDNTITTSGSAGTAGNVVGGAGGAVNIDTSTTVNVDAITTTGGAGFGSGTGGAAGAVNLTGSAVTLEDNITAIGGASGATAGSTGGAGGAVTLESPVTLGAGIRIDTSGGTGTGTNGVGGAIDFQGTLNGTQTLALDTAGSTDGDIHFHGIVGGVAALGAVTIDDAKDVTASAAFTAASLTQTAGTGTTTLNGAVNTTAASGVDIINATIAVNAGITTAGSGIVTLNADTTTLTIIGAGDITSDGAVNLTGATGISTAGNVTTTDDNITFHSATTLTGDVTLTSGTGAISLAAVNNGGNLLTLNNTVGSASTISGIVSGSGGLTKTGTGTLTLSGVNTYTGATTIGAGSTLTLDATGKIESSSGLANNGAFTIEADKTIDSLTGSGTTSLGAFTLTIGDTSNTSGTYSGVASGTGGITTAGTGTLTLRGANTYTGATTIGAGSTLALDFSAASASTDIIDTDSALVLNGATLLLTGKASTTNSQTVDGLTINSGISTITLTANATANPLLLNLGAITHNAGGTINFTLPTGTQSATNGITTSTANVNGILGAWATVSGTDFATNNGTNIVAYTEYADVNRLGGTIASLAASNVRIIEAGSGGNITPAASGTTDINTLLQSASGNATYDPGVADVLRLGAAGGIMIASTAGALTIGTTADDGVLTAGGADDTAGTLTLTNNHASNLLTINSIIDDNGTGAVTLLKVGAGTLILSGTNTYTGATTINAGTIKIAADSGLGAAPGGATAGHLNLDGGTLQTTANMTLNSNRGIALTGAGILSTDAGTTLTYNGILAGSGGALTKAGIGTLSLGGVNTYSTATNINAGTLSITNASALGTTAAGTTVASGATLNINNVAVGAEAVTLSGTGVGGNGALTGTGAASLSGNITLAADSTLGGTGTMTLSGIIDDGTSTFGITKVGTNTVTLSGVNTYGGTTDVQAGTLILSGGSAIASGAAVTVSGGTLDVATSEGVGAVTLSSGTITGAGTLTGTSYSLTNTGTISVVLAGSGVLTKTGSGTATLSGTNTYSGGTALNAGTLVLGSAQALGTTGAISFGGGTLQLFNTTDYSNRFSTAASQAYNINTNGQDVTFATALTSSGGTLTKTGTGTLTLSGANTYTGGTTVSAGTLKLDYTNVSSKLSDTGVLTLGGGTLDLSGGATSHTEIVASTTLVAGTASTVTQTSGTSILRMGAITSNGGTINFSEDNIASTTNTNSSSGILGGWATVGSDWAINSGTLEGNGNYFITAIASSSYTEITRLGGRIASDGTHNVKIVNGTTPPGGNIEPTVSGTTNISTLLQSATDGDATYDPGTSDILRLGVDGGIMIASTAGALTIGTAANDGILTAGGTASNVAGTLSLTNNHATNLLTINSTIANNGTGVVSLVKLGAGTLTLGGTNTYTGSTTISGGTLELGAAGVITDTSAVTVASAATLDLNGNNETVGSIAGAGTISSTAAADVTLTAGGDNTSTTFSGVIQDASGANTLALTKTGTGTLTLSGVNTYSGVTSLFGGAISISAATALGDETATNTISFNGGTLQATDDLTLVANRAITLNGVGTLQSDAGALLTVAGTVTNGTNLLTVTGAGDTTISGVIGNGEGGLTKTGAGTLTLSGLNTYTGATTVTAGILKLGAAGVITDTSAVTVATGATLDLNGNNETIGSLAGAGTVTSEVAGAVTLAAGDDNTSTTFSGLIQNGSGTVAFTKTGTGIFTISGTHTYTGVTTINAGTLALGGNTTLAGNLTQAGTGTLDLGSNTLTLGGTGVYSLSAGQTLNVSIVSDTTFGNIQAAGNSGITGGTVNVTVGGQFIARGTTFTIVNNGGGTTIVPTITTNSSVLSFTGSNSGGDLILTANRVGTYANISTDANINAVGVVLDQIGEGNPTGDMLDVLATLDGMSSNEERADAMATMTPDVSSGTMEATRTLNSRFLTTVSNRLAYVRSSGGALTGISTGDMFQGVGFWMQGLGGYMSQGTRDGIQGYTANTFGTTIGFDKILAQHLRMGFAGGYGFGAIDSKTPGSPRTTAGSWQGTIYGSYDSADFWKVRRDREFSKREMRSQGDRLWYVDGMLAFSQNNYDSRRDIWLGPSQERTAKADHHGQMYSTKFEAGYTLMFEKTRSLEVTPFATLGYNYLFMNKYTEHGADSLDLTVEGAGFNQLEQGLGLKLAYPILSKKAGTFIPSVRGAWLFDYLVDKFETSAAFAGGGPAFSTYGVTPARNAFLLGSELAFLNDGNMTLTGNFDVEFREEYIGLTYYLTLRFDF